MQKLKDNNFYLQEASSVIRSSCFRMSRNFLCDKKCFGFEGVFLSQNNKIELRKFEIKTKKQQNILKYYISKSHTNYDQLWRNEKSKAIWEVVPKKNFARLHFFHRQRSELIICPQTNLQLKYYLELSNSLLFNTYRRLTSDNRLWLSHCSYKPT